MSGSGKSTVGTLLAERLGWSFLDADDLHPPANLAAMTAGIALTDADREPWLALVAQEADQRAAASGGVVVACSALRRRYRDRLRAGAPRSVFVQLVGPSELLEQRMSARVGHFMPPSLLGTQLTALELLDDDEAGVVVTVSWPAAVVAAQVVDALGLASV